MVMHAIFYGNDYYKFLETIYFWGLERSLLKLIVTRELSKLLALDCFNHPVTADTGTPEKYTSP